MAPLGSFQLCCRNVIPILLLTAVGFWGSISSSFLSSICPCEMGSDPSWGPGKCPQSLAPHTCLYVVIGAYFEDSLVTAHSLVVLPWQPLLLHSCFFNVSEGGGGESGPSIQVLSNHLCGPSQSSRVSGTWNH